MSAPDIIENEHRVIWIVRRDVNEIFALLWCYAVYVIYQRFGATRPSHLQNVKQSKKIRLNLEDAIGRLSQNVGISSVKSRKNDTKRHLHFESWNSFKVYLKFQFLLHENGDRGSTVVKVLCYKSEGRWFDSRWCH